MEFDSSLVKTGDRVKKGQRIAQVNNTGNSTGSHLHWEIRLNEKVINAYDLMDREFDNYGLPTPIPSPVNPPVAPFNVHEDLNSQIEADEGLKGYEWYDNHWSFKQIVEFTDETNEQNKAMRTELAELRENNARLIEPTVQNAINIIIKSVFRG